MGKILNQKNKIIKNKKGITLITLVITIIILMILATVVIASITDEDKNIVNRSKSTKKDFEVKQETEILQKILVDMQNYNYIDTAAKIDFISSSLSAEGITSFQVFENRAIINETEYFYNILVPGFEDL